MEINQLDTPNSVWYDRILHGEEVDGVRLISNSETNTWLSCKRKYYFEYILNLEPKEFNDPINKGILIHAVLEQYYASKALGAYELDAREGAIALFTEALMKEGSDMVELGRIRDLVIGYWDHWLDEDDAQYEVYAVETKLKMDMTDDFALVGTIDLIWQDRETKKFWLVDHKSAFNFWTEEQADLSAQFVKYVILGRNHGLEIAGVIVNQIRTRPLKAGNELYRRAYVKPSEPKIATVARQHIRASHEILDYRENAPVEDFTPLLDKYICSNCAYRNLCDTMSNGGSIEYGIQQDFKPRTGYGYNN